MKIHRLMGARAMTAPVVPKLTLHEILRTRSADPSPSSYTESYSRSSLGILEHLVENITIGNNGTALETRTPNSPCSRLRECVTTLCPVTADYHARYGTKVFNVILLYAHYRHAARRMAATPGSTPLTVEAYARQIFDAPELRLDRESESESRVRTFCVLVAEIERSILPFGTVGCSPREHNQRSPRDIFEPLYTHLREQFASLETDRLFASLLDVFSPRSRTPSPSHMRRGSMVNSSSPPPKTPSPSPRGRRAGVAAAEM